MSTSHTNRSTLVVLPLSSTTTTTHRPHSRFFPRNSPLLALEASLPAHTKAQIWNEAITRASRGLKWGQRKNPKHLRVNSAIVEEEVEGGSIFYVL